MLNKAGWAVVGILVGASAYELALALGAGSVGPEPGDGVAGSGVVQAVALLAMLVAAGLVFAPSLRPWPAALFAPAAAAFLACFYYTFDPYFAPQLRRYSEGNIDNVGWIVAVGALALAAGVLTWLRPRVGAVTTSIVLVLIVFTTVLAGDGH